MCVLFPSIQLSVTARTHCRPYAVWSPATRSFIQCSEKTPLQCPVRSADPSHSLIIGATGNAAPQCPALTPARKTAAYYSAIRPVRTCTARRAQVRCFGDAFLLISCGHEGCTTGSVILLVVHFFGVKLLCTSTLHFIIIRFIMLERHVCTMFKELSARL